MINSLNKKLLVNKMYGPSLCRIRQSRGLFYSNRFQQKLRKRLISNKLRPYSCLDPWPQTNMVESKHVESAKLSHNKQDHMRLYICRGLAPHVQALYNAFLGLHKTQKKYSCSKTLIYTHPFTNLYMKKKEAITT